MSSRKINTVTSPEVFDRYHTISERFTYHAPTPEQITKYNSLRTRAKEFGFLIDELCPDSDEKKMALHYLDMAVMNANASIAREGDDS